MKKVRRAFRAAAFAVIAAAIAMPASAEVTITQTIPFPSGWASSVDCGDRARTLLTGTYSTTFRDTVPVGSIVTNVRIVIPMRRAGLYYAYGDANPVVSVFLNGQQIGDPTVIPSYVQCPLVEHLVPYAFERSAGPYYVNQLNSLSLAVAGGTCPYWCGVNVAASKLIGPTPPLGTVEVTYIPPPPLQLSPSAELPATQRRLLLSIGPNDPAGYSSPMQTAPARMQITGRTLDATGRPMSRKVHLRVIDPPDPSPYLGTSATVNDNVGGVTLTGTNGTVLVSKPGGIYEATSSAQGNFYALATVQNGAGGDNFSVEAADPTPDGDPGFDLCGEAGCPRTGEIQVWKRVYVEPDRMFRSGAFLKESVSASPNAPVTVKLESIPSGVGKNKYLMFIHAPAVLGTGEFWSEVVKVTAVNNKTSEVTVERLEKDYSGPEKLGTVSYRYLADAVGLVSSAAGPSDANLYPYDVGLLQPLHEQAFVEYVVLSNDPVPYIPFERDLKEQSPASGLNSMELIPMKWFFNVAGHNTQHLLAGTNRSPNPALGPATWEPGEPWAWIFEDTIKSSGPSFASQRDRLRREASVHELTHNWGVQHDETTTDEAQQQWSSATLLCTMVRLWYCGSFVCTEFHDDVVAFHYIVRDDGTPHSEYLMIRRKQDPLPF